AGRRAAWREQRADLHQRPGDRAGKQPERVCRWHYAACVAAKLQFRDPLTKALRLVKLWTYSTRSGTWNRKNSSLAKCGNAGAAAPKLSTPFSLTGPIRL